MSENRKPKDPEAQRQGDAAEHEQEERLTFSERLLVLWGMIGPSGRARVPVILTYLAVMGIITLGTVLIAVFLWR